VRILRALAGDAAELAVLASGEWQTALESLRGRVPREEWRQLQNDMAMVAAKAAAIALTCEGLRVTDGRD
jgi:hypothetical protein